MQNASAMLAITVLVLIYLHPLCLVGWLVEWWCVRVMFGQHHEFVAYSIFSLL
jgi:hypothetical protein